MTNCYCGALAPDAEVKLVSECEFDLHGVCWAHFWEDHGYPCCDAATSYEGDL